MIKRFVICIFIISSCNGKTTTASSELSTSLDEQTAQHDVTNFDWSGNWSYVEDDPKSKIPLRAFDLVIKQNGENILAQYCAIARSGAKIDCEAETEYNFTGAIKDGKVIGTFYSFFSNAKDLGQAELTFISDDVIQWKIIQATNGESYAPQNCQLKRLKKDNNEEFKTNLNYPLTSLNVNDLDWEETNHYYNHNLLSELPSKKDFSLILAKNDLVDDEFYTLFTIDKRGKKLDSLAIAFTNDGYPENSNRWITDFSISKNYEITLSKFERINYKNNLKSSTVYRISDNGKFYR